MRPYRVLHIDDDPALRDIVEISLGFDPAFSAVSCASGADALALAGDWTPDLILCDVMMPDMDGPATLRQFKADEATAGIPVLFMTANPEPDEIAVYRALGAAGVLPKPFDPARFAGTVRARLIELRGGEPEAPAEAEPAEVNQLQNIYLATAAQDFHDRLRTDLAAFRDVRAAMPKNDCRPDELQSRAHKLAGAAGIFECPQVSSAAATLEQTIKRGRGNVAAIRQTLDTLIEAIETEVGHD